MSAAVIVAIVVASITTVVWGVVAWADAQPPDRLECLVDEWHVDRSDPQCIRINGLLRMQNFSTKSEVTASHFEPHLRLLSDGSLDGIRTRIKHEDPNNPRDDNYWLAAVMMPQDSVPVKIGIELTGEGLDQLKSGWLRIDFIQYGKKLRQLKSEHIIFALKEPVPVQESDWRERKGFLRLPIRTPLLTKQDDLKAIVEQYVQPWAQPGDYLALAETALAIVQGNFRHPSAVQPQLLARTLCQFFPKKTSLQGPYSLQSLIDSSNGWRVTFALIVGALGKAIGQGGWFYALAGYQAPLIDDVTGSLPPYDQFIVLGPLDPQNTVDRLRAETGIETAIVDANDLREVKILAATQGINREFLAEALLDNPAGNADEQTPIVLIRPKQV